MKPSSFRCATLYKFCTQTISVIFCASANCSGRDVAQTEMTNQSLTLEFGQHGQRFFDRSLRWPHHPSDAKIDDIQRVEPEISQIVVNAIDQFLARKSMKPGLVCSPARAHLGDDHQAIRIGMERLLDDLIGHMRTVKVAGIDVVHAGRDRLSQNGNRGLHIARRSPHLRAGKLHRAIAHAVQGHRCAGKREGAAKIVLLSSFCFSSCLFTTCS